jgi:hypothetical protein
MPRRFDNSDRDFSAGYEVLQSQEPLPSYELDLLYDDPIIRYRIGVLIARVMEPTLKREH